MPISYAPETTAASVPTLGGVIMSGFGPRPPGTTDTERNSTSGNLTGYAGEIFAGGTERCYGGGFRGVVWGIVGIVGIVVCIGL